MNIRRIIEGKCAEHKQVRAELHMQLIKRVGDCKILRSSCQGVRDFRSSCTAASRAVASVCSMEPLPEEACDV